MPVVTREQLEALKQTGRVSLSGEQVKGLDLYSGDPAKAAFEYVFNPTSGPSIIPDMDNLVVQPKELIFLPGLNFSPKRINHSRDLRTAIVQMGSLKVVRDPQKDLTKEDVGPPATFEDKNPKGEYPSTVVEKEPNPFDDALDDVEDKEEEMNKRAAEQAGVRRKRRKK